MRKIYDFENRGTTMVARGADSNDAEGLCFGYSSVWCVKMQRYAGQNPLLTRPNQFEAYPLQQRVEMLEENSDWSEAVPRMIRSWGHGCTPGFRRNYAIVPRQIALEPGHYIIDIGDHWVAAGNTGGSYAFFDSNDGMVVYDDRDEFIAGVVAHLRDYRDDPDPDNGWEDGHNIYRITE